MEHGRSEAEREADRIRTAIREGKFRNGGETPALALTFRAFADVWRERRKEQDGFRVGTQQAQTHGQRHMVAWIGRTKFESLAIMRHRASHSATAFAYAAERSQ